MIQAGGTYLSFVKRVDYPLPRLANELSSLASYRLYLRIFPAGQITQNTMVPVGNLYSGACFPMKTSVFH